LFFAEKLVYYRYIKAHYILFDLGYTIHVLFVVWLVIFPESKFLFNAIFVTVNGPMLWGLSIFQIPMVLH
jgi:hypothetical protein